MKSLKEKNEKLLKDISRLVDEVISLEELKEKLATGKKLVIKYGVDCTAPFLHLGHAVNLWTMRRFQEDGHKVIFLIGNFTSKIGDPTGRMTARKVLTDEEINYAAEEFIKQVGKVLITDNSEVFEIRRNGEWYNNMHLADFLGLCSMTTHSKIISRDMFQKRMENNEEIHMNEILYPILQGYDSKVLDSDLTVVGSDQLFNEMMGRFFQEKYNQEKQIIITTKITKGLWGEEKQSKSIGNYIALEDTSKDKFGKAMKLTDDRIIDWMKVYTDISLEDIEKIEESIKSKEYNPRDAKLMLAHAITEKYHGKEIADKEKEEFLKTFSDKVFPEDAEVVAVKVDKINIIELLNICFNNSKSKADLKRLIAQGGVILNEEKIENITGEVSIKSENQLKVGKRNFFKVILANN